MKKRYHLLASVFMLAALPLVAESQGEEIALESQETAQFGNRRTTTSKKKCLECECKEPDTYVVPGEIAIESRNMITPTVYPYISNGMNLTGSVAFLWWQSMLNGSVYAYTGTADGALMPLGVNETAGDAQRPDFEYEPGVKVSLGGNFEHDGWDFTAEYVYLPSSSKNSIGVDCVAPVTPPCESGEKSRLAVTLGDGTFAPLPISNATSRWNQSFNELNFELGRNFFISRYLTWRPHVGMNTAWITEKLRFEYTPVPGFTDSLLGNFLTNAEVQGKQSVWGIGLRGGIDTMWHFTRAFALYGDFAITSFWGRFHIRNRHILTETVGTYTSARLDYILYTVIPVFEFGFGLAHIMWFNDERLRLQTQLGWEHQIWQDFNHIAQGQGNGSLSMQGMTLKAGLTF